jgi:DNA-binding SARP family transcriptional activator
MQLTLRTLGTLEASTTSSDGTARTLARGKPAALLAYLACVPGHKASREHLAALLWGDVDSEAARQNLRQTIWYIKKKLGDGLLDSTGEVLALTADFTCDRDDFLQAAQRADFGAAVAQHRGAFIPDFAAPGASEFEQWSELERRRLTVTFLRCADTLARQWLSEGKFHDAQELARQARDVDPMEQATWRLLLESLVAGSDGLGAASEAEHFEAFLAREEQEPDATSVAAIRSARRAPAPAPGGDQGPAKSIAVELVGRESEFSNVLTAWEQARLGSPRVLVISAAAGLGKSRLLRDVQARLRASRARSLLVRANPGDRHLTGGFVAEVVSQLAMLPGAAAVSTGTAGVLVSLAPALASMYSSATPDQSSGEEALRRRALAVVDLAHAVSDEHSVALLLDDLHWADDHSARVLTAAFTRLEHARLLVVMARRAAADPRGLFTSLPHLDLPPLDLAAVTAFVLQVAELPAAPWADVLPQQLLLATGGSPLLLVETLHDALEQGWLSCSADGEWQCVDPSRITASLRDGSAVRQRVRRLAPSHRHALLGLAIVGRPIELSEALAMMEGHAVELNEPMEELERGGFVMRVGTQVVVAHDAIADAALEAASEDERRMVHAGVARRLLTHAVDEPSLRRAAEHASAAGNHELVLRTWRLFLGLRRRANDRRGVREVAADLLGMDSTAAPVQALLDATPLLQRRRMRWVAMAAVASVLALVAVVARYRRPPAELTVDVGIWVLDSATAKGRLVGVRLDSNEPWEGGAPIEAVDLDSTTFPHMPGEMTAPMFRGPDGHSWWGNGKYTDVGDEGIYLDASGVRYLPLRSPGDDGIASLSPDGRQIAAVTARYDTVTDHLQVIRTATTGGPIQRLTNNPEYDRVALWRPDGTQIATQRHYYRKKSPDQACIVDVDGTHERCLDENLSQTLLKGWLDERHLLIESLTGPSEILDVETGHTETVPGLFGSFVNDDGEFRLCLCRVSSESEQSFYLVPASNPEAARPLLYHGRPLRGAVRYIGTTFAEREWLDTLRLLMPRHGLSVDNVHRLRAEGRRANGAPAWLHDLRWTSRDTTVATIDSTGRLRPRRLGSSWIVVSAGGWRVDSALARITPSSSHTTMIETWNSDWMRRWQSFGIPQAVVVPTDRGPALLPNGDGSYPSGAYSPVPFASGDGVGLEADVNLYITRTQWQTLGLELQSSSSLPRLRTWDHRTGAGPALPESLICSVSVPGDEGTAGLDFLTLAKLRQILRIPVPPRFYTGGWHRFRLQALEDGRCALAIDGRAVGIVSGSGNALPPQAFPYIVGHDRFGGRLVVGHFETWSGVRGGVDWTVLDDDKSAKKP